MLLKNKSEFEKNYLILLKKKSEFEKNPEQIRGKLKKEKKKKKLELDIF